MSFHDTNILLPTLARSILGLFHGATNGRQFYLTKLVPHQGRGLKYLID
jgi:hypothetical protein